MEKSEDITYINDGWEYKLNGNLVSSNFDTTTKFDKLKKGDIIEIKNTIPNVNYNDNTLGILKEFNPNEPSLFVREPYMTDALDPSGNVVVDLFGNTYKKLYYDQNEVTKP